MIAGEYLALWGAQACAPQSDPSVLVAQVVATNYTLQRLKTLVPVHQAGVTLNFAGADEHVELIRTLWEPSTIAMASVSPALLKTGSSMLAPVIGRRHTFRKFLLRVRGHADLRSMDIVFCDSLTMPMVRCDNKIHYRLVAPDSLEDLAAVFDYSLRGSGQPTNIPLSRRKRKKTGSRRKTA